MQKQLVLIGGGHAHMVTLGNLKALVEQGARITVIQPSDYHYYSGMGPGMLGGTYLPEDIRFATRKVVEGQGGEFVRASARAIDPKKQVVFLEDSDREISYDVLSCNAGSHVPREASLREENVFTAKPIEGLIAGQRAIVKGSRNRSLEVAVIGGGPSSIEIAGNIWQLARKRSLTPPVLRIFAGSRLMGRQSRRIGQLTRKILGKRGIEIFEGSYVKEMGPDGVVFENGRSYGADLVFPAVGVKPSAIFRNSDLAVGPDGGLLVNRYLQSTEYPNILVSFKSLGK